MGETIEHSKWEGKTSAEVNGPAAEQVWPLLADFCNFHKWFPNLSECYQLEGVFGEPGLIRYCAASPPDPSDEKTFNWVKEKIVVIDPVQRCFSYEMLENNMGFKKYVATMKVMPQNGINGCKLEWSFVCDPAEGRTLEDFISYFSSSPQMIAKVA